MSGILRHWFAREGAWRYRIGGRYGRNGMWRYQIGGRYGRRGVRRCQIGGSCGRRRAWRHRIGCRYGKRSRELRRILAAVLATEAGCIVAISMEHMDIRLVRQEEQLQAEWVSPWEAADGGDAENSGTVYGIRICPETLEIQFYSRRHTIKSH